MIFHTPDLTIALGGKRTGKTLGGIQYKSVTYAYTTSYRSFVIRGRLRGQSKSHSQDACSNEGKAFTPRW